MRKQNWFTFVEIMIAIVVFSIWVVAVLGLVTTNLRSMDRNDLRLQGTVLAKEWLELVYNMRDSNLERELPWNCIMKQDIFGRSNSDLSQQLSQYTMGWRSIDDFGFFCPSYFSVGDWIQVSFSQDQYLKATKINVGSGFDDNYSWNKLYLNTWDGELFWYSYESGWEETFFARYILFTWVVENSELLDTNKILKVESHVLYQKAWFTWEVVLESFIWNY